MLTTEVKSVLGPDAYFPATNGTPLRELVGISPCNPATISVIAETTLGSSL